MSTRSTADGPGTAVPGPSRARRTSTSLPFLSVETGGGAVAATLADAVRDAVAAGHLAHGDRLPPVRTLAGELGLAPNTVAKAYKDLEADGLLEGRGRAGTFVAAAADERADRARAAARAFADEVLGRLRLTPDEALDLVRSEAARRA